MTFTLWLRYPVRVIYYNYYVIYRRYLCLTHWDSESTYNKDKENKNKNKFIRKFQKTIL